MIKKLRHSFTAAITPRRSAARTLAALVAVFCFALILPACGGKSAGAGTGAAGKPVLAVSILPQSYFSSRIAGDRIRTMVLVGPGQNPHNYEPTPKQMAELAAAGAWVLSGTEFEIGLKPKAEALFPNLTIIDGTAGVRRRPLEAHSDDDDHGGVALAGDDGAADRHTWLGQQAAELMAKHIRDALIAMDAAGTPVYQKNYGELMEDIQGEFDSLREELAPLRGKTVFVYHPAFGYFLDEFGILQEAVETGGKEPSARVLNALIGRIKREQVGTIFVQAQFPVHTAKTLADAAGAVPVALDPLAADWLGNIRIMGDALKASLGGR